MDNLGDIMQHMIDTLQGNDCAAELADCLMQLAKSVDLDTYNDTCIQFAEDCGYILDSSKNP